MSLGLMTLRSILEHKDKQAFRILRDVALTTDEEKAAFAFIRNHLRRFDKLPTVKTVRARGIELAQAGEPPAYYLGRLSDRQMFNTIMDHQRLLEEAIRDQDMTKAASIIRQQAAAVSSVANPMEFMSLQDGAVEVMEDYRQAHLAVGLQGVTTGWPSLDAQTAGLMPGDLFVLVSRPYMGKTYLMLYSARQAWRAGHSAVVVSMEMITKAIIRRWLGIDAGLNPKYIREGKLSRFAENIMRRTVENYDNGAPVHFLAGNFEKSVGGVEQIVQTLRPDIAYVDAGYLLSPGTARKYSNTSEMLSQVVKDLKSMALSLGIPVAITVQFNRQENVKMGNRSTRLDLKNIGGTDAVGQDADIVGGIKIPPSPFSKNHRIIEMMKVREGDPVDFATQFSFEPMAFGEVPLDSIVGRQKAGADEQQEDVGWMA